MTKPIAMACPDLDEADIEAVVSVLRSGRLALGPKTADFEKRFADYVGTRHAIAVSSGTAALHLGALALGLGPDDEVLVPSFTFAASVNAFLYVGARPVFVDIEPVSLTLCADDLERKWTPRTRAILPVDVFGHPAPWDRIETFARDRGLRVLDDACEALGSELHGRRVGSFGDAAAFGFYPNKQITTGEGGILVTNNERIANEVRAGRNQGRRAMNAWLEHGSLGFNYRLDEMSAALGAAQLTRIDQILERRARVAELYTARLEGSSVATTPQERPGVHRSWFAYVVTLRRGLDKERIMRTLEVEGIPTREYFPPVHLQPYLQTRIDPQAVNVPVTMDIAERALALPFHYKLTAEDVDRVVSRLESAALEQESVRS